jgi:hypothetical protein
METPEMTAANDYLKTKGFQIHPHGLTGLLRVTGTCSIETWFGGGVMPGQGQFGLKIKVLSDMKERTETPRPWTIKLSPGFEKRIDKVLAKIMQLVAAGSV